MAVPDTSSDQAERRADRIKVLLVDDSPEFICSVSGFLALDPRIEVVGWAVSARDCIELCQASKPDLILMDISMFSLCSLDAARKIKQQPNPPGLIMLTLEGGPAYRDAIMETGADGYVTKLNICSDLMPLIDELCAQGLGRRGKGGVVNAKPPPLLARSVELGQ